MVSTLHPTSEGRLPTGVQIINPLEHEDWDRLVEARGDGSFFHTSAWARVLHDTYGHEPVYFCKIVEGKLRELLPVMEAASRLTGRRGISLPFTDFCAPLFDSDVSDTGPYEEAIRHGQERGWRYLECRSGQGCWPGASVSLSYYGHAIDLAPGEEQLFKHLRPSVRRGVRKAKAANLRMEFSGTLEAVRSFYRLHCSTRKRHGVPPQPFRFFEGIAQHALAKGHGVVATALLEGQPVAAAVFFHHVRNAILKFGASDYSFQHLRANNLVLWEAIRWYEAQGFRSLHLGRTSMGHPGLQRFKRGFGAEEEVINYCRYDLKKHMFVRRRELGTLLPTQVLRWLSLPLLRLAGRLCYPHMA